MSEAACSNCGHDAKSHVRTMRGRAMAPSVCESSFYCGCKVFARDKIQAPSGSSVPEAARAAAREAYDRAARDGEHVDGIAPLDAALLVATPHLVAAAVAEERATTGRALAKWPEAIRSAMREYGDKPADLAASWIEHQLRSRAALASPGEES